MAVKENGRKRPTPKKRSRPFMVVIKERKGENIMKRALIFIIMLIFAVNIEAAFEPRDNGAKPVAMGGAYVAAANDIYSPAYNPAGIGFINNFTFGANYYSLFSSLEGIDAVRFFNFGMAYPILRKHSIGISMDSFGYDLYKETTFRFTHSMALARVLRLGYNIKYYKLSIQNYGDGGSIGVDVGVIGRAARNITIGAMGYNLNGPKIGTGSGKELEQAGSIGVKYHPAKGLDINAELYKIVDLPLQIRAGTEFRFSPYIYLRGGVQTQPTKFSIGAGINYSFFHIDYAFLSHNELGGEHILSMTINLGEQRVDIYGESRMRRRRKEEPAVEYSGPKININTADFDTLTEIPRVGPKAAQRIIDYRTKNGAFQKIEDIRKVKGFGPKTFAKIRNMITVGGKEEQKKTEENQPTQGNDINDLQMKDMVQAGIKPITALKIIQYIKKQGSISSADDLKNVEGVTADDIAKLKKLTGEK